MILYNKNRLTKLAGILCEQDAKNTNKFEHNRYYHVVSNKVKQFLEKHDKDIEELVRKGIRDNLDNEYYDNLTSFWENPANAFFETEIDEMFYDFLKEQGQENLLGLLYDEDEYHDPNSMNPKEDVEAARAAILDAMSDWLHNNLEDIEDDEVHMKKDSDEYAKDPYSYYGVSKSDFV